MKKKALIAIAIVVVLAFAGIAAYAVITLAPKIGNVGTFQPAPALTGAPPVTVTGAPPATAPASKVAFDLKIGSVSQSGLSANVTATLTNNGAADAHNVWAKVEAFVQGSRVKVNGADYLRVDVGELKAKSAVSRQVTLSFGIFDAAKLVQSGGRFVLTVSSDEATQPFAYDYQP
ncbi:MAG: hypothetical protein HY675_20450 [Chloroflexi bacterium]|nr:hypothetical protein [Chloroflexota bacterium]